MTVVVKLGSTLVVDANGRVRRSLLRARAAEVGKIVRSGEPVCVVSSGAIALGLPRLGLTRRPSATARLQAASALGQSRLQAAWDAALRAAGVEAAQILLSARDLSERASYVNVRNAFDTLLKLGVVPVVNENDATATDEITFGDNDALAAQVAVLTRARLLILLTEVDGVYATHPAVPGAELVADGAAATDAVVGRGSALGRGGMASKIAAARLAAAAGIPSVIASGRGRGVLRPIVAGERRGTRFAPEAVDGSTAFKLLLRYAQPAVRRLVVDEGARSALLGHRRSVLAVRGGGGVHRSSRRSSSPSGSSTRNSRASTSITTTSPSSSAASPPPRAASGETWPTISPCVAPEKRPSVTSATASPSPSPTSAAVTCSISRMPGPPAGPSYRITTTSPATIAFADTAAEHSSSEAKTRAGPRWRRRSWPTSFTIAPSVARLPRSTASPPVSFSGRSTGPTTSWPGVAVAAAAISASVRPSTFTADPSASPASTSSRATRATPPARWRSVATKRPPGLRSATTGVRVAISSKSSSSSGMSSSRAIASRWRTALVEPPVAATAAIAFSIDARVIIAEGRKFSRTRSSASLPVCSAASAFAGSSAGIPFSPAGLMPRNSSARH